MLIVGLVLWLLYLGIIFLRYLYKSKKLNNAYEEISEEFVSGNVAYFEHTSKRGNRKIQSIHMVSDGDVIWNGQFSGSEELFQEAMNIFKTMEPQNQ
mgnify:CR=1 FL=1